MTDRVVVGSMGTGPQLRAGAGFGPGSLGAAASGRAAPRWLSVPAGHSRGDDCHGALPCALTRDWEKKDLFGQWLLKGFGCE